jgi:hypothetical protein
MAYGDVPSPTQPLYHTHIQTRRATIRVYAETALHSPANNPSNHWAFATSNAPASRIACPAAPSFSWPPRLLLLQLFPPLCQFPPAIIISIRATHVVRQYLRRYHVSHYACAYCRLANRLPVRWLRNLPQHFGIHHPPHGAACAERC